MVSGGTTCDAQDDRLDHWKDMLRYVAEKYPSLEDMMAMGTEQGTTQPWAGIPMPPPGLDVLVPRASDAH